MKTNLLFDLVINNLLENPSDRSKKSQLRIKNEAQLIQDKKSHKSRTKRNAHVNQRKKSEAIDLLVNSFQKIENNHHVGKDEYDENYFGKLIDEESIIDEIQTEMSPIIDSGEIYSEQEWEKVSKISNVASTKKSRQFTTMQKAFIFSEIFGTPKGMK